MPNIQKSRPELRQRFQSFPWLLGSLLLITSFFPIFLNNNPGFTLSLQLLLPIAGLFFARKELISNFYFQVAAAAYVLFLCMVNTWPPLSAAKESYQILHFALSASLLTFAFSQRPREMLGASQILVLANVALLPALFLFRISPPTEAAYLNSSVLRFFISPSALNVFDTVGNNVTDSDKAAGILYLNGNQAAGYFVAIACLAVLVFKGNLRFILSALMLGAVFATGSKTPLFAVPMVAITVLFLAFTKNLHEGLRWFFILVILGLATCFDIMFSLSGKVGEIDTFQIRMRLWGRAFEHLHEYWLLGSDENYWNQLWYNQGALYFTQLPVHNYPLRMLMVAGIVAISLIFSQLILTQRRIVNMEGIYGPRVYFAFAAFMYIAIYSLVENFTIFGDTRVSIILACCYATATTSPSKLFGSLNTIERRSRIPVRVRKRNLNRAGFAGGPNS